MDNIGDSRMSLWQKENFDKTHTALDDMTNLNDITNAKNQAIEGSVDAKRKFITDCMNAVTKIIFDNNGKFTGDTKSARLINCAVDTIYKLPEDEMREALFEIILKNNETSRAFEAGLHATQIYRASLS